MTPGPEAFLNLPDFTHFVRVALRLVAAAILGGVVGAQLGPTVLEAGVSFLGAGAGTRMGALRP